MKTSENNSDSANVAVAKSSLPGSESRAVIRRIIASRHFARAHQLQDILLYLAERAFADSAPAVHEHEIACVVLGRKADFNPHEDNIVRVQISHVRKRLDEYFANEGLGESLRVSIPKGAYTLVFEPAPAAVLPVTLRIAPEALGASEARPQSLFVRRGPRAFVLVAGIILMAGTGSYLWRRNPAAHTASQMNSKAHIADGDPLWPRMLAGPNTSIVVADTCLVMLQDILDTDIPLSEYLNRQFPGDLLGKVTDQPLQKALRLISNRQYTSLADLNSAEKLAELSHRYSSAPPAIRYARYMNVRDFKTGNFILVGSRRGIPWVRLFESQLNFSLEEDLRTRSYYYRNKSPRAGEPEAWYQEARTDGAVETYADVALVPNLANTGYVLILSGIGMEASEAAGEFVAGPEFRKALAESLPKSGGHPQLRYFEFLLHTRAVAGAARSSQIVTHRIVAAPIPEP